MRRWALVTVLIMLVAGCGREAAPLHQRYKISGMVRLDGAPLRAGTVNFISVEDKGSAAYPLRDGTFEITAPPGPMRVEVRGPDVRPQYGGKDSPLRCDVAPKDDNHFEFDIPAGK